MGARISPVAGAVFFCGSDVHKAFAHKIGLDKTIRD